MDENGPVQKWTGPAKDKGKMSHPIGQKPPDAQEGLMVTVPSQS